jgi:hypothetical protein
LKENGRDLLTPRNRHWYALKERFQTRPMGRVFCAILDFKITSFVADSSRSYAKCCLVIFCYSVFSVASVMRQSVGGCKQFATCAFISNEGNGGQHGHAASGQPLNRASAWQITVSGMAAKRVRISPTPHKRVSTTARIFLVFLFARNLF